MRRLCLILLCALVAVPAAVAASAATGDGVLELRQVSGTVIIGSLQQPAKGALWGQMDRGTLRVTDPVFGDGQVLVNGWESKSTDTNFAGITVRTYIGRDLHFRVTGGKYKLWFKGAGIDLTAVGSGVAQLIGDQNAKDAGDYALDGGDWASVPLRPLFIPFGTQPPPPAQSAP